MSTIDPLDARILLALDDDPDASVLAIARTLGVARNTVQARLKRLSASALRDFGQRVDPAALGYPLVAFISLEISQSSGDLATEGLAALPEVIEIHSTTGDADLLVKVVARDTAHLYRVTTAMLTIPGVTRSSTAISLAEVLPTRLRALLETAAR
ncbi:MAG: Lrp/AsnC family transcriptional regulator [Propionicimonas sp.]|uniref:Lrp/AsnC family transcriptional regulator n=1 Tax=Propionicimonas sp. TaxID=1955623 RepID=UPI003D139BA9